MLGSSDSWDVTRFAASSYRLVVVSDSVEVGGAETVLRHLVGALPAEVDVMVAGIDEDVVTVVAEGRPTAARLVLPENQVTRWRRAMRGCDVVHINLRSFTACRPALVAAWTLGVPTVLVDHLPTPGLTWRGRGVQRIVTRLAARRLSIGWQSSRDVERFGGLRPRTIHTIMNGVPPLRPAPMAAATDRLVLGTLGRLEPHKGLDLMVEAMSRLPQASLRIAGVGSQHDALERMIAVRRLTDRVQLIGPVHDVTAFLHSIQTLVLPSRSEGMPLVIMEAMHAGVPVVAADVGSINEIIEDGVNGRLVPAGDVNRLVTALRQLADDHEARRRLVAAGRGTAEYFTDTRMAADYDALYRSVLRARRGNRAAHDAHDGVQAMRNG